MRLQLQLNSIHMALKATPEAALEVEAKFSDGEKLVLPQDWEEKSSWPSVLSGGEPSLKAGDSGLYCIHPSARFGEFRRNSSR